MASSLIGLLDNTSASKRMNIFSSACTCFNLYKAAYMFLYCFCASVEISHTAVLHEILSFYILISKPGPAEPWTIFFWVHRNTSKHMLFTWLMTMWFAVFNNRYFWFQELLNLAYCCSLSITPLVHVPCVPSLSCVLFLLHCINLSSRQLLQCLLSVLREGCLFLVCCVKEHDVETAHGVLHVTMRGVAKGNRPTILTYHDIGLNRELPSIVQCMYLGATIQRITVKDR